jgi:secondary thiamine-phosphate synthase enzyme
MQQHTFALQARRRGVHLVTDEVLSHLPGIASFSVGLAHLFLQHTSASLSINENADPSVRSDLERYLSRAVPDGDALFSHDAEGPDDMPAHVKASLLGCSLTIPITQGRLALGTWQGIYLCEHRNQGGPRTLVATLWGQGESPL